MSPQLQPELNQNGFVIVRDLISADEVAQLRAEADRLQSAFGKICIRGILQHSQMIRRLATALAEGGALQPIANLPAVSGILFDKTPQENWPVPWHQDLSIAISERSASGCTPDGYQAPTVKDGVPHLQPPVELLERMVTLRLHLDDTPPENGALQIVPGSHKLGRIDTEKLPAVVRRCGKDTCTAAAGDALLMKPLILHASARTQLPRPNTQLHHQQRHRRVIHLEYAPPDALACALEWYELAD